MLLNTESDAVDLVKRAMISRSTTQTIEGSPGTSIIRWDVQETNPYPEEFLTPSNEFGEPEDPEIRRRAAIQALEKVGTSEHMDNYSTKQLLLGLGESVTGVDALRTDGFSFFDPTSGAAGYFDSIESEDKFRTFVIYRPLYCSQTCIHYTTLQLLLMKNTWLMLTLSTLESCLLIHSLMVIIL